MSYWAPEGSPGEVEFNGCVGHWVGDTFYGIDKEGNQVELKQEENK